MRLLQLLSSIFQVDKEYVVVSGLFLLLELGADESSWSRFLFVDLWDTRSSVPFSTGNYNQ